MRIIAAVWLVAGGAAQVRGRLVHVLLLQVVGALGMAYKARRNRTRLQKSLGLSRVRVVAGRAIFLRAGVLHLRRGNLLRLFLMAHAAGGLHIFLRQHDFAIRRGRVAVVTLLVLKWLVN